MLDKLFVYLTYFLPFLLFSFLTLFSLFIYFLLLLLLPLLVLAGKNVTEMSYFCRMGRTTWTQSISTDVCCVCVDDVVVDRFAAAARDELIRAAQVTGGTC